MAQRISSLLLVFLAGLILFESTDYPFGTLDDPGPGFLPFVLGLAIGLMSIAYGVRVWTRRESGREPVSWPDRQGWAKITLIFITLILFPLLLDVTGYLVNVFLLFLVLLRPVGKQTWKWTLALSVAATVCSYLLFDRWLMLPLPRGIWFPE